jgi:hypothetical protein
MMPRSVVECLLPSWRLKQLRQWALGSAAAAHRLPALLYRHFHLEAQLLPLL